MLLLYTGTAHGTPEALYMGISIKNFYLLRRLRLRFPLILSNLTLELMSFLSEVLMGLALPNPRAAIALSLPSFVTFGGPPQTPYVGFLHRALPFQ